MNCTQVACIICLPPPCPAFNLCQVCKAIREAIDITMQLQQAQVCIHILILVTWQFQTPRGTILVYFEAYTIERLHVTSQGAWLSLILMLQSCKFFKVILEVQVTQICSMDILRLTIDFIKMSKVWSLCMEFYGAWQEVVAVLVLLLAVCKATMTVVVNGGKLLWNLKSVNLCTFCTVVTKLT